MKHRTAFTLVELLVVIGVIALLISMLLPALSGARESARTVDCLSQLRQIGVASMNYVADNRGYLFPSYYDTPPTGAEPQRRSTSLQEILEAYLPPNMDRKIWTCGNSLPGTTIQYPQTYGANQNVHPRYAFDIVTNQWRTLRRISQVRRPSEVIAMGDASQSSGVFTAGGWLDNSDAPYVADPANSDLFVDFLPGWNNFDTGNYHLRFRHNKNTAVNCVFVDGHGQTFRQKELKYRNLTTAY